MSIKPIETHYNGYRFRSRLEARWAVFFDAAGIKYEYEPEGFERDGVMYLPDFYLPDLNIYAEVKGNREGIAADIEKCRKFIYWGGPIKQLVFLGQIPGPVTRGWWHFPAFIYTPNNARHDEGVEKAWFFFFDNCEENVPVSGHVSCANYHSWRDEDLSPKGDCEVGEFHRYASEWHSTKNEWISFTNYMAECLNKRTIKAYEKARQARFEHGETPEA